MKCTKVMPAKYHSVSVDYLLLRERQEEVSEKLRNFENMGFGKSRGNGGVCSAVIAKIASERHPRNLLLPMQVFLL